MRRPPSATLNTLLVHWRARLRASGPLSLTPCDSGVLLANEATLNVSNGSHHCRFRNAKNLRGTLLWLSFLLALPDPLPADTIDASGSNHSSCRIISERNIFNPNRSNLHSNSSSVGLKPAKAESLSLVGTLASTNGIYAFFDGSAPQYKRVLKLNDRIAGHDIAAIGYSQVTLLSPDHRIEMPVGVPMIREDEGEWKLMAEAAPPAGTSSMAAETKPEQGLTRAATEWEKN